MTRRATVRLLGRCDNACVFCGQSGTAFGDDVQWADRLADARSWGADEVTFTGGEPALSDALVPAIARARELGFVGVGVQTHGGALDSATLERWIAAGLSDVHLSIHGARAVVHDHHVGRPGRFAAIERALDELMRRELPVVVTTVVTRSNARVLGELPAWLASRRVVAWCVDFPRAAGAAAKSFDRVMPRLALAVPFALHAIDRARKLGIPAAIRGAPLCLLGPWAHARMPEPERAFASACDLCDARPSCTGIDSAYLQRFSGDELRARPLAENAEPMPEALARRFVGPGELVQTSVPIHDSASAARRRLPVLARPAPGLEEDRSRPRSAAGLFAGLRDEAEARSADARPADDEDRSSS